MEARHHLIKSYIYDRFIINNVIKRKQYNEIKNIKKFIGSIIEIYGWNEYQRTLTKQYFNFFYNLGLVILFNKIWYDYDEYIMHIVEFSGIINDFRPNYEWCMFFRYEKSDISYGNVNLHFHQKFLEFNNTIHEKYEKICTNYEYNWIYNTLNIIMPTK